MDFPGSAPGLTRFSSPDVNGSLSSASASVSTAPSSRTGSVASRVSIGGVAFTLQIGLAREPVALDPHEMTLGAVRELACSVIDQKVRLGSRYYWGVFLNTVCGCQMEGCCISLHTNLNAFITLPFHRLACLLSVELSFCLVR
uniref:Serine/threonine-protein kinase D1-3-like ubiquitin-like domain-containing protein n=1 Tax=Eptatretus burgeri TaxID=7764 RepID=A0A8C4QDU6_EPTBU